MLLDGKFPAYEEDLIRALSIRPLDLDADFALRLLWMRPDKPERVVTVVRVGSHAELTTASLGIWTSVWSNIYWAKKSGHPPKATRTERHRFELAAHEVEPLEALATPMRAHQPRGTGFENEDATTTWWALHQKGQPLVHFGVTHPQRDPDLWLETVEERVLALQFPAGGKPA